VKEGPANRSYGLQVAQLAGVPHEVIAQARHYLETLEAERDTRAILRAAAEESLQGELPLIPPAPLDPRTEELRREVEALDPDALSPREAHAALYRLRTLLGKLR
jgi:DNA mismatch repair protein MutS